MKSIIAKVLCCSIAFVSCFLLTVHAFGTDIYVSSKILLGYYYTTRNPHAFINIAENKFFIYAYRDDQKNCYVSGTADTASVYTNQYSCRMGIAVKANEYGAGEYDGAYLYNYYTDGFVNILGQNSVSLDPSCSSEVYKHE